MSQLIHFLRGDRKAQTRAANRNAGGYDPDVAHGPHTFVTDTSGTRMVSMPGMNSFAPMLS